MPHQFNSQAEDGSRGSSRDFQQLTEEVNSRAWNLSHISWFQSKCLNHNIILQAWDTNRTFNPPAGTSWSIFHHFYSKSFLQAGAGSGLEEPRPVWDLRLGLISDLGISWQNPPLISASAGPGECAGSWKWGGRTFQIQFLTGRVSPAIPF